MRSTIRDLITTLAGNSTFRHYDVNQTFAPFTEITTVVETYHDAVNALIKSNHYTPEGGAHHRSIARQTAIAAITKFRDAKLPGLEADIASKRKVLAHVDQVDLSSSAALRNDLINKFTPQEINVLYNSADDATKVAMEHASIHGGKRPVKSERGVEWLPLLDESVVADARTRRMQAKNPAGFEQMLETEAVRNATITITKHALADVSEIER